jgi:hypothetical protein
MQGFNNLGLLPTLFKVENYKNIQTRYSVNDEDSNTCLPITVSELVSSNLHA